jgi:type II secretory pathway component GspD/PulD (secretin)
MEKAEQRLGILQLLIFFIAISYLALVPVETLSQDRLSHTIGSQSLEPNSSEQRGFQLDGKVKLMLDPKSGLVTVIGSPRDIQTVRRLIEFLDRQQLNMARRVTKPVRLHFQQAQVVASILDRAKMIPDNGMIGLSVEPLNFPERVLLSGPSASVSRAKWYVEEIDRHPRFTRPRY